MPTVSSLKATRAGRVAVHVDGEYLCSLSEAGLARRRLFVGRELAEGEVLELRDEAHVEAAIADAHRFLSHRSRARGELADRLSAKGYDEAVVSAALERLDAAGLLDDAAFARAFVSDKRVLSGWGRQRIARELGRLGVEPGLIVAELGDVGADVEDEAARAMAVLARHGAPRPPLQSARKRAFDLLRRRGFATGVAYEAVNRWSDTGSDGSEDESPAEAGEGP